jgi:hypothetical protein
MGIVGEQGIRWEANVFASNYKEELIWHWL